VNLPTSFQSRPLLKLALTLILLGIPGNSSFVVFYVVAADGKAGSEPSSKAATTAAKSQTTNKTVARKSSGKSGTKKMASRYKKVRRSLPQGQRTIEPARVIQIQSALAVAGYYNDEPTGQWDDSTSKAMSAYQQDNGFKTTGKPDALSLKKLGL
jgi:peptidoglycan hydrolase-like protein with peptidoglycan-binding domain